ncbi:rho GTPase-activating protein 24-like isoform X2 [Anneissia japonica]|uniref:rho GTPase-activating protein 24-like isoform X2 n=1 Tax=Anneissia japonica TaxID=1529436 RepID=UPI001425B485|nr:rho GTPase-activating protein 24-like isoform X2 [Anneissia japonica]
MERHADCIGDESRLGNICRLLGPVHIQYRCFTLSFAVQRHNMTECRPFSPSSILHQGWLKKQGGVIKSWQRRFFVLAEDHMYYYQREDETKHLGAIPLKGNKVFKHPHNPDDPKFLFEISQGEGHTGRMAGNHDTFLLMAATQIDMDNWIQAIQRVMYARVGGGVFGQSLLDIITNESTTSTKTIPSIVEQCVKYISENGLKEEGIFRLAGRSSMIKTLQDSFDAGDKPDFDRERVDIHTVASLLKLYLRELPEPVIPWAHYDDIMNGIRLYLQNPEQGRKELIKQLALLPRTNYNLLRYMCDFLHSVSLHEEKNKMNVQNIATVFGPNIIRPNTDSPASLMQSTTLSHKFVHLIIEKHKEMFPPNDMIDFTANTTPPLTKLIPIQPYSQPHIPVAPPRKKSANPHLDLIKEVKVNDHNLNKVDEGKLIDIDDPPVIRREKFKTKSPSIDEMFTVSQEVSTSLDQMVIKRSTSQAHYAKPFSNRNNSIHIEDETFLLDGASFEDPMQFHSNGVVNDHKHFLPERPPKPLQSNNAGNVDFSQSIPDVAPVIDRTLTYEHLQQQVEVLKLELKRQKEEHEQKLHKMEMKYAALEIKFLNEESARKSADERNRHLLQRVNTFYAEYGPK